MPPFTRDEMLGALSGALVSPAFGIGSFLRRARVFHPRGIVLSAQVEAVAAADPERAVAERLRGPALVRLSGALWKRRESPDILGCAVRFRRHRNGDPSVEPSDQDLMFLTVRSWPLLPLAPLVTNAHDYLANVYFAVSPFEAQPLGIVRFRLRCRRFRGAGSTRDSKLLDALHHGPVVLELEAQRVGQVARYLPLVRITLHEPLPLEDAVLRFDPFRAGRGIHPVGFVQHMRFAAYPLSQRMRSVTESQEKPMPSRFMHFRRPARARA